MVSPSNIQNSKKSISLPVINLQKIPKHKKGVLNNCHTYVIIWVKTGVGEVLGREKKRAGRPRVLNPKNVKYSIRLDQETEGRLVRYCEREGISRGEAVRRGVSLLIGGRQ